MTVLTIVALVFVAAAMSWIALSVAALEHVRDADERLRGGRHGSGPGMARRIWTMPLPAGRRTVAVVTRDAL